MPYQKVMEEYSGTIDCRLKLRHHQFFLMVIFLSSPNWETCWPLGQSYGKNGKKHILLGCGGSGPTKRIGPEKFTKFMDLVTRDTNCKFFIAAGSNEEEQKIVDAITNSKHKQNCIAILPA